MKQKVKIFCKDTAIPVIATKGSAGYDLRSTTDLTIKGFDTENGCTVNCVNTGVFLEIPVGYQVNILPKSGLAAQGISVVNSPGLIDSDYRDEIKVLLQKTTVGDKKISKGDKIAQMTITKVIDFDFEVVDSVEKLSKTGRTGGFGSTGSK